MHRPIATGAGTTTVPGLGRTGVAAGHAEARAEPRHTAVRVHAAPPAGPARLTLDLAKGTP